MLPSDTCCKEEGGTSVAPSRCQAESGAGGAGVVTLLCGAEVLAGCEPDCPEPQATSAVTVPNSTHTANLSLTNRHHAKSAEEFLSRRVYDQTRRATRATSSSFARCRSGVTGFPTA